MIRELALKNRSYRRFYGEKKIDEKTLRELVVIARNTPSAANRQPLQYRLVCDDETNSRVYDCLGWAGYYKDWDGPVAEERPSAYIIMVTPQDVNPQWDEGIAGSDHSACGGRAGTWRLFYRKYPERKACCCFKSAGGL